MEFVELGERLGRKETELREFVDKKELEKLREMNELHIGKQEK
jgi:hypothetical protein